MSIKNILLVIAATIFVLPAAPVLAQDMLPADNGLVTYHTSPRYRESESHPLRIASYILHPVGWVAREVIFRPFSYFASSTPVTRSVMGYREPYDYRQPECFSADDSSPDCRTVSPFNYAAVPVLVPDHGAYIPSDVVYGERHVYFPDVNFDFDARRLNDLGEGRVRQIALLMQSEPNLTVVLQGHTDYIGAEEYNERLGMDRAEAVRAQLVKFGVSPERLSTVSFGKGQPVFPDSENWARAVNRRVEIHVSEY